jgi:predicted anti-sigma-YlaC factor YlaD
MNAAGGQLCARARFWVSLRIDGELSQLEGALLDAHLVRCPDCREFAAGAEFTASKLRPEGGAPPSPQEEAEQKSPVFTGLSSELRD